MLIPNEGLLFVVPQGQIFESYLWLLLFASLITGSIAKSCRCHTPLKNTTPRLLVSSTSHWTFLSRVIGSRPPADPSPPPSLISSVFLNCVCSDPNKLKLDQAIDTAAQNLPSIPFHSVNVLLSTEPMHRTPVLTSLPMITKAMPGQIQPILSIPQHSLPLFLGPPGCSCSSLSQDANVYMVSRLCRVVSVIEGLPGTLFVNCSSTGHDTFNPVYLALSVLSVKYWLV